VPSITSPAWSTQNAAMQKLIPSSATSESIEIGTTLLREIPIRSVKWMRTRSTPASITSPMRVSADASSLIAMS
jgi:hypothetical protein